MGPSAFHHQHITLLQHTPTRIHSKALSALAQTALCGCWKPVYNLWGVVFHVLTEWMVGGKRLAIQCQRRTVDESLEHSNSNRTALLSLRPNRRVGPCKFPT